MNAQNVETHPQSSLLEIGNLVVSTADVKPLRLIEVKITAPNRHVVVVNALPDTGANVSGIPPNFLTKLGLSVNNLDKESRSPAAADARALQTLGTLQVEMEHQGITTKQTLFVIKELSKPILSLQALREFRLVPAEFPFAQVNALTEKESKVEKQEKAALAFTPIVTGFGPVLDSIANKYPSVFDGNCKIMKGEKLHIDVDPSAVPVSTGASRTIPEPLLPALRQELDTLLAQGIIEPVEEATAWLHPIVLVPKKGTSDVRLCVDFSKLNRHIIRPVNAQPTPWEVVRKIPKGTKHFAVFDALKGYHQIELDDESKNLTTFLTPFGRFRYLRLPFGLNLSGDCFTKKSRSKNRGYGCQWCQVSPQLQGAGACCKADR